MGGDGGDGVYNGVCEHADLALGDASWTIDSYNVCDTVYSGGVRHVPYISDKDYDVIANVGAHL